MSVGFEPTPMKTTALTLRLRPLGHDILLYCGNYTNYQRYSQISQVSKKRKYFLLTACVMKLLLTSESWHFVIVRKVFNFSAELACYYISPFLMILR